MVSIQEDDTFTQIVRFDCEPAVQMRLVSVIASEVHRWIRHRSGFVSSSFHASHDGRQVINYAQWRDESSFKGFTADPETKVLQAAIREIDAALKPHALQCRVIRSIEAPSQP